MNRISSGIAIALLVCAAAPAATINTTLTVTATVVPSADFSSFNVNGTTNMTGGIGAGTIKSSISLAALSGTSAVADYTITLTSGGTLTGKLTVPVTVLTGGATSSATVSITVTGGTGTYAGATAPSFNLTGAVSGTITTGYTLTNFTGNGVVTTGGTGGGGGTPTPTITDVLDAGSYSKNIARGSIFVVKGTLLSAAGYTAMSFPLPQTSSGVKITFTLGNTSTDAYLVYLYNQGGVNQLAGVLPSTLAAGTYNVTVTNGTVSAPFAVQVVDRKIGLITADSSGSGLAVIQNYISAAQLDIARFSVFSSGGFTFSPSRPGQILIAWATGLGPVTSADNTASPGFDFNTTQTVRVLVGGRSITPLYAGRAPGLAGADQINFQLPADITTGCTVPFQVSVNGVLSQMSFIAIAPDANATVCVQPGYTPDQLKKFDGGGSYTSGGFSISQFSLTVPQVGAIKSNTVSGAFNRITGFQLNNAPSDTNVTTTGACQVTQTISSVGTTVSNTSVTALDAGNITVTGPAGSSLNNTTLTKTNNTYAISATESSFGSIPGQLNFTLPAGNYTINGAGGTDVGSFSTSLGVGTPLTLSAPLPATVSRSSSLTLNWTGGNASDLVEIIGGSSTSTGSGTSTVTTSNTFICTTTAGARTFTVPASVIGQLAVTDTGILYVASGAYTTFNAPLKAGGNIDAGVFTSFIGIGGTPAYR